MGYHEFNNRRGQFGSEKTAFGSFEVFYNDQSGEWYEFQDETGELLPVGWYWWACFPGCIPDGDFSGPFETEEEAIRDANDF